MGWVEKHGKGWRARTRHRGRPHTIGPYRTKTEARRHLAELEADLSRGVYHDPKAGRLLFVDWVSGWEDRRQVKPSTASTDRGRIKNHLRPFFGGYALDEITADVDADWVVWLGEKELAGKTIRNCHGLMHTVMRDAVRAKKLTANPCEGTRLPEVDGVEMVCLTPQQYARLRAATHPHWVPLLDTLYGTGMRWGEAMGLHAGEVDAMAGTIRIVRDLDEVDGRLAEGTLKTRSAKRTVTIGQAVRDALIPLITDRAPHDPVFRTPEGYRPRRNNFHRRVWQPAVAAAGLEVRPRPHDLRHSHASWLIASATPLTAICRRLGHTSIRTTSDTYGHLLPEVDERLVRAVNAAMPVDGWEQGGSNTNGHHVPASA